MGWNHMFKNKVEFMTGTFFFMFRHVCFLPSRNYWKLGWKSSSLLWCLSSGALGRFGSFPITRILNRASVLGDTHIQYPEMTISWRLPSSFLAHSGRGRGRTQEHRRTIGGTWMWQFVMGNYSEGWCTVIFKEKTPIWTFLSQLPANAHITVCECLETACPSSDGGADGVGGVAWGHLKLLKDWNFCFW